MCRSMVAYGEDLARYQALRERVGRARAEEAYAVQTASRTDRPHWYAYAAHCDRAVRLALRDLWGQIGA